MPPASLRTPPSIPHLSFFVFLFVNLKAKKKHENINSLYYFAVKKGNKTINETSFILFKVKHE